jgi:hypothetical protein
MFGVVLLLLLLVSACASKRELPDATAAHDHSGDALPASPNAAQPPASVVEQIASSVGVDPQSAATLVRWREVDLAPNGPRVVLAVGRDTVCRADNCPMGVFAKEGEVFRALLLTKGQGEPRVWPIGHLGYPDLSVTAVATASELRLTRFQWDGTGYSIASCRIVDRITAARRNCVVNRASETSVTSAPAASTCSSMRRMVESHPSSLQAQQVLSDGFVLRADDTAHVEALKLPGSHEKGRVEALVQCLRTSAATLKRVAPLEHGEALATSVWSTPSVRTASGNVSIQLTSTPVHQMDYTLVSLGVFAAAAPAD